MTSCNNNAKRERGPIPVRLLLLPKNPFITSVYTTFWTTDLFMMYKYLTLINGWLILNVSESRGSVFFMFYITGLRIKNITLSCPILPKKWKHNHINILLKLKMAKTWTVDKLIANCKLVFPFKAMDQINDLLNSESCCHNLTTTEMAAQVPFIVLWPHRISW